MWAQKTEKRLASLQGEGEGRGGAADKVKVSPTHRLQAEELAVVAALLGGCFPRPLLMLWSPPFASTFRRVAWAPGSLVAGL